MAFREHAPVATIGEYLIAVAAARAWFPQKDRRGDNQIFWFRGQGRRCWRLVPKFYRPEFAKASEPDSREQFQTRAIQLVHGRQPQTDWEWYFLMQHHGAPTRLLDWSENPLVALYFAVKGHASKVSKNHRMEDAAVWLLDPEWLNAKNPFLMRAGVAGPMSSNWKEAKPYLQTLEKAFEGREISQRWPAAIDAPHVDARLNAQASRFVVFGKVRDLIDAHSIADADFGLGRVSVLAAAVPELEYELANLGIHEASVFPDLDGLGQFVCDSWTL